MENRMLPNFVTTPEVATAHNHIAAAELGQICVLSQLGIQTEKFASVIFIVLSSFSSNIQQYNKLLFEQSIALPVFG